ncbi:FAD-dependent oxidoreductase [Yinghuangia aomiensis]
MLVDAPYAPVKGKVRLDRRAVRIEHGGGKVRVHTVSEDCQTGKGGVTEVFEGDEAIVTVPFSGLRHVAFDPPLAYGKRRAITELHYDAATKVLLEFSRRWWEFTEDQWKEALDSDRTRPLRQVPVGPGQGRPVPRRAPVRSEGSGRRDPPRTEGVLRGVPARGRRRPGGRPHPRRRFG